MAVKALQRQVRQRGGDAKQRLGLPGLDGDAEFGIHLSRGDRLIGVRINARRQAKHDALHDAARAGNAADGLQLLAIIRHEAADARFHRVCNLRVRFVISMEIDVFHRKSGQRRGVNLPGGDDVYAHVFFAHDLVDPLKGGRLAGVKRQCVRAEARAHGLPIHPAILPDARFIHEIQRRAILRRERYGIVSREVQYAVADGKIFSKHRDILLRK